MAQQLALVIMACREEVEAAVSAGRRMMRVDKTLHDGTKVFTHPLRFKVSEAWYIYRKIHMLNQLCVIQCFSLTSII